MKLDQIADGNSSVTIGQLALDKELTRDIQNHLSNIGLLDPPADGSFGPVSRWALGEFMRRVDHDVAQGLDPDLARKLSAATADALFPIRATHDFAGRLATAVLGQGHWLCRHPEAVNVIYVEGMDTAGNSLENTPNRFDDIRVALRVSETGVPEILGCWDGTTEPGRKWTETPMNPEGAARIAFGQYKSWGVGTHLAGKPSGHEALVQTAPVTVFRDLNKDYKRIGDKKDTGLFGINQHWGYDLPPEDLGTSSAGCLVGRLKSGHREFMKIVKSDKRYNVSNNYRFMTAILENSMVS